RLLEQALDGELGGVLARATGRGDELGGVDRRKVGHGKSPWLVSSDEQSSRHASARLTTAGCRSSPRGCTSCRGDNARSATCVRGAYSLAAVLADRACIRPRVEPSPARDSASPRQQVPSRG